jgi:hypothetical protein
MSSADTPTPDDILALLRGDGCAGEHTGGVALYPETIDEVAAEIERLQGIASRVWCELHNRPAVHVDTCTGWSLHTPCQFVIREALSDG